MSLTKEQKKEMKDLFLEIWKERKHVSQVSGKYLGPEPLTWMFDHLLEKNKYPEVMFEKWNIALVTFEEHEVKTKGFPYKNHCKLIDEAMKRYEAIKKAPGLAGA